MTNRSPGFGPGFWAAIFCAVAALAGIAAFAAREWISAPAGPAEPSSSETSPAPQPEDETDSSADGENSSEGSSPADSSSGESSSEGSSSEVKSDRLTITESGDYTDTETLTQVVIRAGEVRLANKTITGDLFIMDEVDGDVELENVTIGGNLYVYGSDLLTLDSVTVPNARLQRDNREVNILLTGDSQIDETLIMCSASLRERGLGRSEGFVNFRVENGGLLIKNNITLLSVHADLMEVNYNSRISLSGGTEIDQVDANAKLTLAGLGKAKDLVVRNDYVQYSVDPDNITVKRGYAAPVKVEDDGEEDTENSLLDDDLLELDPPEEVWLYEEDGLLCLEYSHVEANDGYYVVVYHGSKRLKSVYTDVDEESLILTELDPSWEGDRFYAKVKALGDRYDSTADSEFADSETFRWE